MPSFPVGAAEQALVEDQLRQRDGLHHLHVRIHGSLLVIESGPAETSIPHARFRRISRQYYQLEFPTHTGRWEKTPFRAGLVELIETAVDSLGWMF